MIVLIKTGLIELVVYLRSKYKFFLGLVLLGWLLVACAPLKSGNSPTFQPGTPAPVFTLLPESQKETMGVPTSINCPPLVAKPTLNVSTSAPHGNSSELTYEENLRINPPAPSDLWAVAMQEGIVLCWQAPPIVVGSTYGDKPLQYKIYRRGAGDEVSFLTQAIETHYVDTTAAAGVEYSYTISGIYGNKIEGARSPEVRLTKP